MNAAIMLNRYKNLSCVLKSVCAVLCLVVPLLIAQDEDLNPRQEYKANIFSEAFVFKSDQSGKGRVDVFIQVPYSEISFVKDGDSYVGSYEVTVSLLTSEKKNVWQNNQLVEIRSKDFSQTTSNRFSSLKQFSNDILPGEYELLIQILDRESKKTVAQRKPLSVRCINQDSLALSDLMLVHRLSIDDNRKNIVPNLTGMLGKESNSIYLFFEVYNSARIDSINMVCKFLNSKKEIKAQYSKNENISGARTQIIWRIDSLDLTTDSYLIVAEAEDCSKGKSINPMKAVISRSCLVKMKNLPPTIADFDKATEQLVYIARESEIDFIRGASALDEKLKRFLAFWAKHDPDPKTESNELMEEYYRRVAYADKNFASFSEGWKTDRGMVFIRFGPPQNIERHPFDADSKPYEIWYYYDQNREFIFIDDSGFGDYRLRYPERDLWGRIR
jgi:GWxTD domain-containing protein